MSKIGELYCDCYLISNILKKETKYKLNYLYMKKQQNHKISLRKLIIAKINTDVMHKIKGGSSLPSTTMHSNDAPCVIDP